MTIFLLIINTFFTITAGVMSIIIAIKQTKSEQRIEKILEKEQQEIDYLVPKG